MTIGRIPKVDPGATQPQDRKPSPPAGRAASRRPRPARIGAAQTVAARIRRRLQIDGRAAADDPGVQERGRRGAKPAGKPAHPQTSSQAPEGNAQGSAKAFWQQQAGASTGSARPAPKRENNHSQQQSQAPSAQPQAQTTGGWKKTASGWSQSPQSKSNEQPAPPLARGQFEYHDYATVWQAKAGPTIHRSGPGPRRFYAKTRAREYRAVPLRAGSRQVVPGRPSDLDQRYRQNGHRRSRPTFPRDTKAVEFFDLQITPEALLAMRELPIESFQAAEISGYMQGDGSVVLPESLREIRLGGAIPAMQSFLIAAGNCPSCGVSRHWAPVSTTQEPAPWRSHAA